MPYVLSARTTSPCFYVLNNCRAVSLIQGRHILRHDCSILGSYCSIPAVPNQTQWCMWTSRVWPTVVAQYLLIFFQINNVLMYFYSLNLLKGTLLLNSQFLSNQIYQKPMSSCKASMLVSFHSHISTGAGKGIRTILFCLKLVLVVRSQSKTHLASIQFFKV